MKASTSFLALTAWAAAVGCASPNRVAYSAINTPPRPFVPRTAADVDVSVGKPPARPYVEVGLFEVDQGTGSNGLPASTESMIDTLREHAALRGCDAVQVKDVAYKTRNKWGWTVVTGICEMYTDEPPKQADIRVTRTPIRPLPGEGRSCSAQDDPPPGLPCPDPLVCSNKVCVAPYR
jgi:hypothetical protein